MKISNKLLSGVLGCDCEFFEISKNEIIFTCKDDRINDNIFYNPLHQCNTINLDTFIQLALYGSNEAIINAKRKEVVEQLEKLNDSDN